MVDSIDKKNVEPNKLETKGVKKPVETLKEPMKVEEPPTKIEKIEVPPPKPTFQRGLDGVWYF